MSLYPPPIESIVREPKHQGPVFPADAEGAAASFTCGSFVRYYLSFDAAANTISRINYRTNGCGFMVAAAEVISAELLGKDIRELHRLEESWLTSEARGRLEPFETGRENCRSVCIEAIRFAFDELRSRRLAEFRGESPLICSCFGVDEESIVNLISGTEEISVNDVGEKINAGRGCGSCRMMIQEFIDELSVSGRAGRQK